MLIALPFLALFFIFLSLSNLKLTKKFLFREKIIISLIIWSLVFVFLTEGLSLLNRINVLWITFAWLVIVVSLGYLVVPEFSLRNILGISSAIGKSIKNDLLIKLSLFTIFIILLITFVLAIFVAPNNADAMSYHLARIPHWIQNQNVSYYPTHITWQIYLAPFASYPKLHFQLLSEGDYFANFLQWIFMLGTLLSVSLVARHFKADFKTQIFASFIAATIPMGILQSTSSEDSYITAFFFISFLYFNITLYNNKYAKNVHFYLVTASASLGLAFLTKQTTYIFALPYLLWFFSKWLTNSSLKKAFAYSLLVLGIATLVNLGFFARNYYLSGLPIFSLRDDYINKPVGIESLVSGTIKNIALHLPTPNPALNSSIFELIEGAHKILNIPINKPGFNWVEGKFTNLMPFVASEYIAPNTIHFILFLISAVIIWRKKKNKTDDQRPYLLCIVFGFILFSAVLRWQPSGSRLHLPLFVAGSALIAFAMVNLKPLPKYLLVILLLVSSFYFLFFNRNKPIIADETIFALSREEQYFFSRRNELYKPYVNMSNYIATNKYNRVGLIASELYQDYEYPLWAMLIKRNPNVVIKHVGVNNPTNKFARDFKPQVVVFLDGDRKILKEYIDSRIPVIGLK